MDIIKKAIAREGKPVLIASMGRSGSTYFQNTISRQFWRENKLSWLGDRFSSFSQVGAWNPSTFRLIKEKQIIYKTHSPFHNGFAEIPLKIYVYGNIMDCILSTYRMAKKNSIWWREHLSNFNVRYCSPELLLSADPLNLITNISSYLEQSDVVFVDLSDAGARKLNHEMKSVFSEWKPIKFEKRDRETRLDRSIISKKNELIEQWHDLIVPALKKLD